MAGRQPLLCDVLERQASLAAETRGVSLMQRKRSPRPPAFDSGLLARAEASTHMAWDRCLQTVAGLVSRRLPIHPALWPLVAYERPRVQLAAAPNEQVVAVAAPEQLQLHRSADPAHSNSPVLRCNLPRDPAPAWRQLAWAPDSSWVAVVSSTSDVYLVDARDGQHLLTIAGRGPAADLQALGLGSAAGSATPAHALLSMDDADMPAFATAATTAVPSHETPGATDLLLLGYDGRILAAHLPPLGALRRDAASGTSQPLRMPAPAQLNLRLDRHFAHVSTMFYSSQHSLLVVGGVAATANSPSMAPHFELWRRSDDGTFVHSPVNREPLPSGTSAAAAASTPPLAAALSPAQQALLALDCEGNLSVLAFPSLRVQNHFPSTAMQDAFDFPETTATVSEHTYNGLTSVAWWDDSTMVLVHSGGALVISPSDSLVNLLGRKPETLQGPALTVNAVPIPFESAAAGAAATAENESLRACFLVECERSTSKPVESATEGGLFAAGRNAVLRLAYCLFHRQQLHPDYDASVTQTHNHHLLVVQSTTPLRVMMHRLDEQEYGEALQVAQAYGLDLDLIYRRQWEDTRPITKYSVTDYLRKISDQSFVLQQCLRVVAPSAAANLALAELGLALTAWGQIFPERPEPAGAEVEAVLAEIVPLTPEQRELLCSRMRFLDMRDRIKTFEAIIDKLSVSFTAARFLAFRQSSLLEVAVLAAEAEDMVTLHNVLFRHGDVLRSSLLLVLSAFPESTPPSEYAKFLPRVLDDGSVETFRVKGWRPAADPDWAETAAARALVGDRFPHNLAPSETESEHAAGLAALLPPRFREAEPTAELLGDWLAWRAQDIADAGFVDHAFQLTGQGLSRNVPGLDGLLRDLQGMSTLVYECQVDGDRGCLRLAEYRALSVSERVAAMLGPTTDASFLADVEQRLLPFLQQAQVPRWRKGEPPLLAQLLLEASETSLVRCEQLVENADPTLRSGRSAGGRALVADPHELAEIALSCIYACRRPLDASAALATMQRIWQALPSVEVLTHTASSAGSDSAQQRLERLERLEADLVAAKLFCANGIPAEQCLPLVLQQLCQSEDVTASRLALLDRMLAAAVRRGLDTSGWAAVLADLHALRRGVLAGVPETEWQGRFVRSVLGCSRPAVIAYAARFLNAKNPPFGDRPACERWSLTPAAAAEAAVTCARSYANSAVDCADPALGLARACLRASPEARPVRDELELLQALELLGAFGSGLVPIQVRLAPNRLALLPLALAARKGNYKLKEQALRLAGLTGRVKASLDDDSAAVAAATDIGASQDPREFALQALAQQALREGDATTALEHTHALLAAEAPNAWMLARDVGASPLLASFEERRTLLAVALQQCPPKDIPVILQAWKALDVHASCAACGVSVAVRGVGSSSAGPVASANANASIASRMDQAQNEIKACLVALNAELARDEEDADITADDSAAGSEEAGQGPNGGEWRSSHHPFFQSTALPLGLRCGPRRPGAWSWRLADARLGRAGLARAVVLLRARLLRVLATADPVSAAGATATGPAPDTSSATPVLSRLLVQSLSEPLELILARSRAIETPFAYACLLALLEPDRAQQLLEEMPVTKQSLQAQLLFYALALLGTCHGASAGASPSPAFMAPVRECIAAAAAQHGGPSQLQEAFAAALGRLEDIGEAEALAAADADVDVARFCTEPEYAKEVLLGFAGTGVADSLRLACQLAPRHGVDAAELHTAFAKALFSKQHAKLAPPDIKARLEAEHVAEHLQAGGVQGRSLATNLHQSVDGADYPRLTILYKLACAVSPDDETLKTELKLLSRLKGCVKQLDFVQLVSAGDDVAIDKAIGGHLTPENVSVFAKNADLFASRSAAVYKRFCVDEFLAREGEASGAAGSSPPNAWLRAYEALRPFYAKMDERALDDFYSEGVLSARGVGLPAVVRLHTTQDLLKHVRSRLAAARNTSSAAVNHDDIGKLGELEARLGKALAHLQTLQQDPFVDELRAASPEYARRYDLAQGDVAQLEDLLRQLVLDKQSDTLCQRLLEKMAERQAAAAGSAAPSMAQVMLGGVSRQLGLLRGEEENTAAKQGEASVAALACFAERCLTDASTRDQAVAQLASFVKDDTIALEYRRQVRKMMTDIGVDGGEEEALPSDLFLQVQQAVETGWQRVLAQAEFPDNEVEAQVGVLQDLALDDARQAERMFDLLVLLDESAEGQDCSPFHVLWLTASKAAVACSGTEAAETVLAALERRPSHHPAMTSGEYVELMDVLAHAAGSRLTGLAAAVALGLGAGHEAAVEHALGLAGDGEAETEDGERDCSERVASTLHAAASHCAPAVLAQLGQTPLFAVVRRQALRKPTEAKRLAKQLANSGRWREAGLLALEACGVSPAFATVDMAAAALRRL